MGDFNQRIEEYKAEHGADVVRVVRKLEQALVGEDIGVCINAMLNLIMNGLWMLKEDAPPEAWEDLKDCFVQAVTSMQADVLNGVRRTVTKIGTS